METLTIISQIPTDKRNLTISLIPSSPAVYTELVIGVYLQSIRKFPVFIFQIILLFYRTKTNCHQAPLAKSSFMGTGQISLSHARSAGQDVLSHQD